VITCPIALADSGSEGYSVGEPADWVQTADLFDPAFELPGSGMGGVHYRTLDRQINAIVPGETSRYNMREYALTTMRGVEDYSHIEIEFDPIYQSLTVHEVTLLRGETIINKLATAEMRLLQREDELESLIYNGTRTLSIVLDDVRVGDVIRYAYSVEGDNPIFNGLRELNISTEFSVPVDRLRARVLYAEDRPLTLRRFHSDVAVAQHTEQGVTELLVDQIALPEFKRAEGTPNWRRTEGRLVLSDLPDWSSVVEWALPMYTLVHEPIPELQEIARTLRRQHNNNNALVGAALRWVQDEIRYFGVELGVNSHQPSLPADTLQRRLGDCKDKSMLLVALLAELGIDSQPALVDTGKWLMADAAPDRLHAFDHVIVHVRLDGESHWLDPTDGNQSGDIGQLYEPDYGKALILAPGSNALTLMASPASGFNLSVDKHLVLAPVSEGSAILHVTSRRQGLSAEIMRSRVQNNGLPDIQEDYENYYRESYPSLVSTLPLSFAESDGNSNETQESYSLEDFWQIDGNGRRYRWIDADDVSEYLSSPSDAYVRTSPYALNHPNTITERWVIDLPWAVQDDQSVVIEANEYFELERKLQMDSELQRMVMQVRYKTLQSEVPVTALRSYADAVARATDLASLYIEDNGVALANTAVSDRVVSSLSDNELWIFLAIAVALLYAIAEWLSERWRIKDVPDAIFYPVSGRKLVVMLLLTYGLYVVYWFFRNFRYLKRAGVKVRPVLRSLFSQFFYYSLFRHVYTQLGQHTVTGFPAKRAALGAVAFFLVFVVLNTTDSIALTLPLLLLLAVLLIPLIKEINLANGVDSAAYQFNSRWCVRHAMLALAILPLTGYILANQTGLIPTTRLMAGTQLWGFQRDFLVELVALEIDEPIEYFYSADMFDFRLDGNGYTDRTVFSYWVSSEGNVQYSARARKDIISVDQQPAGDDFAYGQVLVSFGDDDELILYTPEEPKEARIFVSGLMD
jgi:hypothetical protein